MIAIKNVRLIDGTGKDPVSSVNILIENGLFQAVGEDVSIPETASVTNAEGLTAIPGLIDMHTHLGGSDSFDDPPCGNRHETYDYVKAREGFLKWGVTTVRTCGDQVESVLSFREEANSGKILSPRIVACGPFFQIMDGHPWGTVYSRSEVVRKFAVEFVDLEEPVEAQVDRIAALGVDFIKAFYPADKTAKEENAAPRMSFDQLIRLVNAAHKHGLKCACHIDGPQGMLAAAEAGADTLEHAVNIGTNDTALTDEMAAALKASGAVVDPTMIATYRFLDSVPDGEELREALEETVGKLYRFSIPMAVGCDSGIPFVPHGESLHDEMQCLAKRGIPAGEVLRMASLGNAEVLGLAERIGSIEAGKEADLILLGGDPIEDISNTKDIRLVLLRGKIVRDDLN